MSYVFTVSMHPKKHSDVLQVIEERMESEGIKKSEAIRRLIIDGARTEMYREALEVQTRRFHSYARACEKSLGWQRQPIDSPLQLVEHIKSGQILQ